MRYTQVTPEQASKLQQSGALLVDIRQSDEFRREHLPDAVSLPLDTLIAGKNGALASPQQTVIFHCQSGMRTQQNIDALIQAAAPAQVAILEGGLNNWKQSKLPTVQDKRQPRPLMQQVQIVAGTLILSGVVLGYAVNPGFFLLSGFVGAGLLFAGLSGWCGMALLLAKMPWNRAHS
ncbi:Rhodanese sulfurtransferase family protein [Enterobacter sp. FY-07]|uniref:rhodanese family protein n=1 Tax=Kosakonia oryzendophytica TaxID=1005665 RepID=UPI000776CC5F|nr:rhodanese family protein [Kosakonia oryzendophytica]AMO47534.1 Rhodanese sulfurtransferase family protein [Enterobacter sp. FY-07]TDT57120.1 rhodanese-related sulfurtransferase [Enterobacter sp. AG5470]WBT59251.1 rhodanese family protein [Kosakonia oryzendophytica]